MNEPQYTRLKEGDKVEIADRASPHCGKIGRLISLIAVPITMIDRSSRPISQRQEYQCKVKLEDTETTEEFSVSQLNRIP